MRNVIALSILLIGCGLAVAQDKNSTQVGGNPAYVDKALKAAEKEKDARDKLVNNALNKDGKMDKAASKGGKEEGNEVCWGGKSGDKEDARVCR